MLFVLYKIQDLIAALGWVELAANVNPEVV